MSTTVKQYARETLGSLLDQTAFHLAHAARQHDAESVHRLRVSIRRLQQGIRLFRQYVDEAEAKKVRKQLREFLRAAAEVRNRDIAVTLIGRGETHAAALEAERGTRMRELVALLKGRAATAGRWRAKLGLN